MSEPAIDSTAGAVSLSVAGGSGGGVGVAFGTSVASNEIRDATILDDARAALTRAAIENATIGSVSRRVPVLAVSATTNATVNSGTVYGGVAIGGGGGGSGAGVLAGAFSFNKIFGTTEAEITASTVYVAAVGVVASNTSIIDADAGAIAAAGAGGAGAGVAAGGANSLAINTMAAIVRAAIETSSTVNATGGVTVTATSNTTLDASSVGFGGSGAGGTGSGVAVAGAGSESINAIANTVSAEVIDSTILTPGTLSVTASDTSTIDAVSGSAGLAGAGGGAAGVGVGFGVSYANNRFGNVEIDGVLRQHTVRAIIDPSYIGTSSNRVGSLVVSATTNATIKTTTKTGALAGAGGAGGGVGVGLAGAFSFNEIWGVTEATVGDSVVYAGSVDVTASNTSHVNSDAGALAAAGAGGAGAGVAVGLANSLAINKIGVTVTAAIQGGATVDATGTVSVTAAANATIQTWSVGFGLSGAGGAGAGVAVSGAGAESINAIANTIEARISASTVRTPSTVTVNASDTSTIEAVAGSAGLAGAGGAGAGVGVGFGISVANNSVGNVDIDGVVRQHTVRATVVNSTMGSAPNRVASLAVSGTSNATIDSKSLTGAAAGAGGAGGGVGVGLAGAFSANRIQGLTESAVSGSAVYAGSVGVSATTSSKVKADAGAFAAAGAGGAGAGVAVGLANSLAINTVQTTTRAKIESSTIDTTGAVSVTAVSNGEIRSWSVGFGLSGAGGAGAGVAVSGAGAESINAVASTVEALVSSSAILADGTVTVTASDTSLIDAIAGSAGLAGAGGAGAGVGVGFGISVADNRIGNVTIDGAARQNTVTAKILNSTVGSVARPSGAVLVEATATSTIDAWTVAGALAGAGGAGGGVGAAGSGARSENSIATMISAEVVGGTLRTKAGSAVTVHAKDDSTIVADVAGVSIAGGGGAGGGGAGAIGAAIAQNLISVTVEAVIDSSTVISGGAVALTAESNPDITSTAIGIAGSLAGGIYVGIAVSGAGAFSGNQINSTVAAEIRNDSIVSSAAGYAVTLTATDDSVIGTVTGAIALALSAAIGSASLAVGIGMSVNDIGTQVRSKIDDSKVTSGADVVAKADGKSQIDALAYSGALAASVGGAITGGGATAKNNIHTATQASITNSDTSFSESQEVVGTNVKVTAEDHATIKSRAYGVSAAIAAGISFTLTTVEAVNTITSATTAGVPNSKVRATAGNVELLAKSYGTITSTPTKADVALSAGASIAAGSVLSQNNITPNTSAYISAASHVTASAAVKVEARDESTITATVLAVSVSAAVAPGAVAVAVGVSTADNQIGGSVSAYVSSSTVNAQSGSVTITAESLATINTTNTAISLAISLISAAGTSAVTTEDISPNVNAYVDGGAITASGAGSILDVDAKFTGTTDPATTGAAGATLAFSAVTVNALIGGTTSAYIQGSATITASGVDVDAADLATSTPTGLNISAGGLAGVDTELHGVITRTTQAYIGAGTVNVGSTAITMDATSTSTATVDGANYAIGVVSLSGADGEARVSSTTQAYVGDDANVTAGTLDVNATAANTVRADSYNLQVGFIAGTGLDANATDDSNVHAWVGPPNGSGAGATSAVVTVTGATLNVKATLNSTVVANVDSSAFTAVGSIGDLDSIATSTPDVYTYLGEGATVVATGATVTFLSTVLATAKAVAEGVAGSLGVAGGSLTANSDLNPTAKSFTVSGGSISGADVKILSHVNRDDSGNRNPVAGQTNSYAQGYSGTYAIVGVAVNNIEAVNSPSVDTYLGAGTTVNASGTVTIRSRVFLDTYANLDSNTISGVAVGVANATSETKGTTKTHVDGTVGTATTVTVESDVRAQSSAYAETTGGGIAGVAIGGAVATVGDSTSTRFVDTYVAGSGRVTASGDIAVSSVVRTKALAETDVLAAGGVAGAVAGAQATVHPSIYTSVRGGGVVESTGGSATLLSAHNFDPGTSQYLAGASGYRAAAVAGSIAAGLVAVTLGASDVTADAKSVVEAYTESGSTLRANGSVGLVSRSSNVATSEFKNVTAGGIAVTGGVNPEPTASGETRAKLLGNVLAADGSGIGAASVDVLADSVDHASASLTSAGGGLVDVNVSNATSAANPRTEIELGASGSKVKVSGNIGAAARADVDSDATNHNTSGGVIRVSLLNAGASASPELKGTIWDGSSFTAGGTITIAVEHNKALPNGSFDAGTQVDTSNGAAGNSITFASPHGFVDGEVITYDARGNTVVGGLTADRNYGIVVIDGDTVALGATFQGGSVDTFTDTIAFAQPHNLENGDLVYYWSTSGGAVGGLTSGTKYKVFVADDTHVKLQDPAVSRSTVHTEASTVSSTTVTASNNFQDGDPVTYHAPGPVLTNDSGGCDLAMCPAASTAVFNDAHVEQNVGGSGQLLTSQNLDDSIYVARDRDGDGTVDPHLVQSGDAVVYNRLSVGGTSISGLSNGTTYYAIRMNNWQIKLAASYCLAVGTAGDPACVLPDGPDPGSDPDPIYVTPLAIADSGQPNEMHRLHRSTDNGLSLTDGGVYFVSDATAGSFRLKNSAGSYVTVDGAGLNGGPHMFRYEGVDISSSGSGSKSLVFDLTGAGSGIQQLVSNLSYVAAPSGDRTVTSSAASAGGGGIDIQTTEPTADHRPKVTLDVRATTMTAGHISITTDNMANVKSLADTAGGGAIAYGASSAVATADASNKITVFSGAVLSAVGVGATAGDVTIAANTVVNGTADATANNGGLIGIVKFRSKLNIDYDTHTTIDGDVTASGKVTIGAHSNVNGLVDGKARTGGLGADADGNDSGGWGVRIGASRAAYTLVDIQGGADIIGNEVEIVSDVPLLKGTAKAYAKATALGADSDAGGYVYAYGTARVILATNSEINGNVSVVVRAQYGNIDIDANPKARCSCGAGDTDARAGVGVDTYAHVVGRDNAVIKTADLLVASNQYVGRFDAAGDRDGGWLDDGGTSNSESPYSPRRWVFWASTVKLLGEPNPVLVIDSAGTITQKTYNVTVRSLSPSSVLSAPLAVGDTIPAGYDVVVDPIIYDSPALAQLVANDLGGAPAGEIWGNSALFEIQETWDYVTITNNSDRDLVVDDVDTVNDEMPRIVVAADTIRDDGALGAYPTGLNENSPETTFDFAVDHIFPRTLVDIWNFQPGGIGDSDIILDGDIYAPIGETTVENDRGDILVDHDADVETIVTNKLWLDADTGTIGEPGPGAGRYPVTVELVVFVDDSLTHRPIHAEAEAKVDVVVDVVSNRRDNTGGLFTIDIASLRAGRDVDVVLNDGVSGTNPGTIADLEVDLFNPPAMTNGSDELAGSGNYQARFRPDVTPTGLVEILRAFGTDRTEVDSYYVVDEVLAGDDIEMCHLSSYDWTCETTGTVDTTVEVDAYTDSDATLYDLDTGQLISDTTGPDTAVSQIDVLSNGGIYVDEPGGDMYVGHVHSTGGDVYLRTPRRVLDADGDTTADVTGRNITAVVGTGGSQGGFGTTADFVEIDVDRNNSAAPGKLTITDTASANTDGVFVTEIVTPASPGANDLKVGKIQTNGDASLVTENGSVVDANAGGAGDASADVLADDVDVFADQGSIGSTAGTNDLDVDSSWTSTGDVGLRATDSVYVTETDSTLHLILAQTSTGDVRLTVRESADLDEDLDVIYAGSVLYVESAPEDVGDASDYEIDSAGWVEVRIGDDLVDKSNTTIEAAEYVDVYLDDVNLDPTQGADTKLVGTLRPGPLSGGWIIRVFGHTDVDTIEFEQTNLDGKTKAYGSQNTSATDGADGEDRMVVDRLLTMDVASGHTLTLDGQAGSDNYWVYTTGSQSSLRNYVVNVLDKGAEDDGVDELAIFGVDGSGNGESSPGVEYPVDDIFLLRRSKYVPSLSPGETQEVADEPGFVALAHGNLELHRDTLPGNAPAEVQRVNYDTALNGRLSVYGLGGNDYFAVDDNSAITTLDGGAGFDKFQIGQIFGLKRDTVEGLILPNDVFPNLVAMTRGWLSPGTSAPLVAQGGSGNDTFTVYSNQAELRLEGDDDNDIFEVRAFALAAVVDTDANGDGVLDANDIDHPTTDTNGDGNVNAADAHTTAPWEDDVVIRDGNGVARPVIGAEFSTQPVDIRTGGGDDEVRYNVNAPVSVDGGNGFDKLVILGTEFPDDFVITDKGVFGAGLNVRFANVEVLEVDGLEGDDVFHVQSTAFGVATRIIGGLGSDIVNVTGDITDDIVVRELEGISSTVNHLVRSGDPGYDGIIAPGIDLNVSGGDSGLVVVDESGGFTSVREDGTTALAYDSYTVKLARAPTATVYVTVSAARSPQEQRCVTDFPNAEGACATGADGGPAGETVLVSTSALPASFYRNIAVGGAPAVVRNRAVTLVFTPGNYDAAQTVHVYAFDDLRPEGDRVMTLAHSVISGDADFDGFDVRNVEVTILDNDTPGVRITEVEPGTSVADGRSVVLEGDAVTRLADEILVELAAPPASGVVVVKLVLDEDSDRQITFTNPTSDSRFDPVARTITFTSVGSDWRTPVRVGIVARDDFTREDPAIAVIGFERDGATTAPGYVFAKELLDVEAYDNDGPGALVVESEGNTLVISGGDTDDYTIRLTSAPLSNVEIAVLTDGLVDVKTINGAGFAYRLVGGIVPFRLFQGNLVLGTAAGQGTLTRGSGSDFGSFADEGFAAGQHVRVGGGTAYDGDYTIATVTAQTITLTTGLPGSPAGVPVAGVALSRLSNQGQYTGAITFDAANNRVTRSDDGSFLADGFLEGQRVRIDGMGDFKIQYVRGSNATKDETLEFTPENVVPGAATGVRTITRIAAVVTFTPADWWIPQTIELEADTDYVLPPSMENVKNFPVQWHLLSKLRGPLAVEGGVTGADRSLKVGVKLPGEADAPPFMIGEQPPEGLQIDVLNVFDDSSQADKSGTMTSTNLSGFAMAKDLDFGGGAFFGEPNLFPGGISYGSIVIDAEGHFLTDQTKSTIEILNVMLGAGNDSLTIAGTLVPGPDQGVTATVDVTTSTIVRRENRPWADDGFMVGQTVMLPGLSATQNWTITGFASSAYGAGTVMTLGGPSLAAATNAVLRVAPVAVHGGITAVHGGGNALIETDAVGEVTSNTLRRDDGLAWAGDGYAVGQTVTISGHPGQFWTIAGLADTACPLADPFAGCGEGSRMVLSGPALTPGSGVAFTVAVYDPKTPGVARIGGDHVVVTGGAGPDSPLVVYGDTSQDGVWYGGSPANTNGFDFGLKPFDPFGDPNADDPDLEDDTWVFPLADPYDRNGHDVIDATALFASADGTNPANLPAVGFTAYGGGGDDTIYGSQTGDHLAGGSGDDVIEGNRGVDHVYGDSGVNVDLLTRALTIPTVNMFVSPLADPLTAGRDRLVGDGPRSVLGSGEAAYDDVIFGDHGAVTQDVADPNLPDLRPQKIQTTGRIARIDSKNLQNGADDVVYGHLGRDILIGNAGDDMIDGDEADDLIFGDNVELAHRIDFATGAVDISNPRFQTLIATLLYSRSDLAPSPSADASGVLQIDGTARNYRDPDGVPYWAEYVIENLFHSAAIEAGMVGAGTFGDDYLAGGPQNDVVFGQLGDDVVQGDGGIEIADGGGTPAGAWRTPGGVSDPVGPLTVNPSFDATTDGEDYVEGGGGDDVIFGNLGQDDLVGGSSDFYTLTTPDLRPDGADLIFGGSGTRVGRNDESVPTTAPERHARDADVIVGDNANIHRVVGVSHVDVQAANPSARYVTFNYDNYGSLKIVVRGVTLLDYTPGGPAFRPDLFGSGPPSTWTSVCGIDIGGADEIHGETGDDAAYGGCGNDVFFGDGDDDDLIGGWGDDWFSGGTGQDGVLGDDGRIFTSRNASAYGEPLSGVAAIPAGELSLRIDTPGDVQVATVNVANALKKTFDLTPYNLRPNALGADDPLFDANAADDVVYGGLGDDFLHGASGDDAVSGAEALAESYIQRFDTGGNPVGLVRSDWSRPWNPGDVLLFGTDDDAWHSNQHVADRLGEFYLYDEYDPRRTILFNADGTVWKTGAPPSYGYLLSWAENEGPVVTDVTWGSANSDGDDVIFGDLGNDWSVGGTGKDTIWGGWGNDLSNADDILSTNGNLNDVPDTHPSWEDRVFGGAGLDVLIGNTGGDRLIDWVGEFNSYIVPFAPFGIATVSRQRPPQLDEFLYRLSASQGADPTRDTDTGNDPARNGEPDGEIGLVTQKDHGLWQDQTGGPTDPQPGNIPGGRRDVLRSADFNDGSMSSFAPDSGAWSVSGGALSIAAGSQGGDAVAVFYVDDYLPVYYEVSAKIRITKPTAGWKANVYVIFDYFGVDDFKFAGVDDSRNKIQMGHRDATGWHVDAETPYQVASNTYYTLFVAVNGTYVTVVLGNKSFSYTFPNRVVDGVSHGLNQGLIGFGSDNSRGSLDNIVAQILPPTWTLESDETFDDGVANLFTGDQAGTWTTSGGRHSGTAASAVTAYDLLDLGTGGLVASSFLEIETTFRTSGVGGIVFDAYAADNFKFVALDIPGQRVLVGHHSPKGGWSVDKSVAKSLSATTDYTIKLNFKGASVSMYLNGQMVTSWGYNSAIVDGAFGTLSRSGTASFDVFKLKTNDPAWYSGGSGVRVAEGGPPPPGAPGAPLDDAVLAALVESAKAYWVAELGAGATSEQRAALDGLSFVVVDLAGDFLGQSQGRTIYVDATAAGYGYTFGGGSIDALAVVTHEIGHVLGYEHGDAATYSVMEPATSGAARATSRRSARVPADNGAARRARLRGRRPGIPPARVRAA